MLERNKPEHPTAEYDSRLEQCKQVCLQVHCRHVEQRAGHYLRAAARQQQRNGQYNCRYADAKRQHIYYLVIAQRDLLAYVIEAQAQRGNECQYSPHTQEKFGVVHTK